MSENALKRALYVLIGAAVVYAGFVFFGNAESEREEAEDVVLVREVLAGMQNAALNDRTITTASDTFVFARRRGMGWRVNEYAADTAAIHRLTRALRDVEVVSIVSDNPASHGRMSVTMEEGRLIEAGEDSLIIGEAADGFQNYYARVPGRDATLLLEGDLRAAASRSLVEWRNRLVMAIDTSQVQRIEVVRDGISTIYEREDSVWMALGETIRGRGIPNLLQEAAMMRATDFAPDGSEMPENPERITRLWTGGEEVMIGEVMLTERDDVFWVKTWDRSDIFELSSFRANRIAPTRPGTLRD